METIFLKAENNQLVESNEGLPFTWDGTFYVYYGGAEDYKYNNDTYNCFPIITISEDCKRVEDITMFGCVVDDWCDDGELNWMPVPLGLFPEVKPFMEMLNY